MDLVIRNVRLIDGTGADAVPRGTVGVAGDLISYVGEDVAKPRGRVSEEVNGYGFTLIPGMIDCHEHFTGDGGLDNMEHLLNDTPEVFTLKAVDNCRRALFSGVTSARDVGARFGINIDIAKQAASGEILGPRIISAGEWLQYPGTWPPGLTRRTETPEELRAAIRDQVDKGAGLIKIGATGSKPDGQQWVPMSRDAMELAVKTAHEAGLKIAAHCHGFDGSHQAVLAGVDSVDHGSYLCHHTVDLMVELGTYHVPTMSAWDSRLRLGEYLGLSDKDREFTFERRESSIISFRLAFKAGVRIAAGTDAGGAFPRHGNLSREIELMVEAGMSPKQALESATRVGAELMGIDNEVGTIEVGKKADMVLIDGDPSSDLGALRNVWAVYQSGRRVR